MTIALPGQLHANEKAALRFAKDAFLPLARPNVLTDYLALTTSAVIATNLLLIAVPRAPAPTMIATAIRAAMRPYSIAVAPDCPWRNVLQAWTCETPNPRGDCLQQTVSLFGADRMVTLYHNALHPLKEQGFQFVIPSSGFWSGKLVPFQPNSDRAMPY